MSRRTMPPQDGYTLLQVAGLPAVIDTSEASRVLRTSPQMVRRMCEESMFRCMRVGTIGSTCPHWRIVTSDFLMAFGLEGSVGYVREKLGVPAADGGAGADRPGDDGRAGLACPRCGSLDTVRDRRDDPSRGGWRWVCRGCGRSFCERDARLALQAGDAS